jgi:hypothetical protein
MRVGLGVFALACVPLFSAPAAAQNATDAETQQIALNIPSGTPLRLYLTRRIPKRAGAPVEAKLLEPIFAFDREVIPAGTIVQGDVSRTQPIGKWQRVRAIVSGDFTPLRSAEVEFTTLILPDGRKFSTHTVETTGLNSIYTEPRKNQKAQPQSQNNGILGTARQTAKDRVASAIDSVRGPNKKERLIDLLWSKLPYRPQYVRRGTRFDGALRDPLEFGFEPVKEGDLTELGSQPLPDSVVHVRLLTPLSSASAKQGETVDALVTAPLFSPAHKLVLPEGTRLTGTVAVAKRARSFHRGGQLRFTFQKIDLPEEIANLKFREPEPTGTAAPEPSEIAAREPMQLKEREPIKTQAVLAAAEGSGKAQVKVDSEGGVKAKESKTRFIEPLISLAIASHAGYEGRHRDPDEPGGYAGGGSHVSGRTLGGGLGLGMLGAAVSQSSPYVGMAFAYYGLAWSVYSRVIARGFDVEFDKNAMMDIRFSTRTPPQKSKIRATLERAVQGGGVPR